MTQERQKISPTTDHANIENILVVSRKNLFQQQEVFTGFQPTKDFTFYQNIITAYKEFLPRPAAENDPSYKQIIPYLVFEYKNTYFLMRRKSSASESRLKDKYSLGIGGHLRQEDLEENDLFSWAQREFFEEINYQGTYSTYPLGIINDESNPVGQVHTGFVFLLKGTTPDISIKAEHKEGRLISLEDCKTLYELMEPWSQFVYNYLKTNPE